MSEDNANRPNLYDYFGFPSPEQRAEARNVFNLEKITLIDAKAPVLLFFDTFFELYNPWCHHINNYCSNLGLHLLLMYYQYEQNPLNILDTKKPGFPSVAHKILFDAFAEDACLYLISYFDKHLEMFNDLFCLSKGEKCPLSRKKIIYKMKDIDEINALGVIYKTITESQPFQVVKGIRDNFVHNKSSTFFGANVARNPDGVYAVYNSKGISTQETYKAICELTSSYEQLCKAVNNYVAKRISAAK